MKTVTKLNRVDLQLKLLKAALSLHIGKSISKLTKWRSCQCQVVIHELSPSNNHHSSRMIMISFVGVDRPWDDSRQWQIMTGYRDSRRIDAVGVEWSDESLERRVCSAPCWVFQVITQAINATIFAWTAFNARQERRTNLANKSLRSVDLRQTLLDVFVTQAVTIHVKKRNVSRSRILINNSINENVENQFRLHNVVRLLFCPTEIISRSECC